MKIYYTDHAEEQLAERAISKADIRKALTDADRKGPAASKGCTKYVKKINGREISVVADVRKNRAVVVTVWKKE